MPASSRGDRNAADARFMRRCLTLARRAWGRTAVNPMVGCVIVDRRGRVIAEGYHRRIGAPHGEADALARAGKRASGCTMYVNLEPCGVGKRGRTPPCAPQVLEAGIRRLVIGAGDPITRHAGGARWLARRGVEVVTGVLEDECLALNRAFYLWAGQGRPLFVLKAAITLDGKVATRAGESRWITGEAARADGHHLRNRLDAIMVGLGTVLADDPQLTVRGLRGGRDPVRVVVDSRLRTPPTARLLPANSSSRARVVLACTERAARTRRRALEATGAELWTLPAADGRVDLQALAVRLGAAEISSVLVEGGAELHGGLLEADLADELRIYLAPTVFGGQGARGGPSWVGGTGIEALTGARRFAFVGKPRQLGPDIALVARPVGR